MMMWKACEQPVVGRATATTVIEPKPRQTPRTEDLVSPLPDVPRAEELRSRQIAFRRALLLSVSLWNAFIPVDIAVIRYLHAGLLTHFLAWRAAVDVVLILVIMRMHRSTTPTDRSLTTADLVVYTSGAIAIALMCVEFRGIASPYLPGLCLVLFVRFVTTSEPWKRGIIMAGIPIASFILVLFGSALFLPDVARQLHDPAAITTFFINSQYVLSTAVSLVFGGHIVWSLRRQVFEARSLGRYRLKRRLAAGGMGDVWIAYHPGLKRDVAVKILRPDQQERSGSARSRFEREVRATAELAHPNTVRVFDYGVTEDGLWYYVMELLEGETLADHVQRLGRLAPARAVHITGQVARALAEAHERGIVHRDIKPENLFLTSLGGEHDFVKVIDFGIAKMQTNDGKMTDTGALIGTPAYMSPEMAMGLSADARSDVYALGAVLYFLLTGRPPFDAESAGALVYAHVNQAVSPPSDALGRALPPDVEAVVMRALQKDPAARYQTAAELALALASCTLAGKWTFGDATYVAKRSSRPPPPPAAVAELLPSLRPPRVPVFTTERVDEKPAPDADRQPILQGASGT